MHSRDIRSQSQKLSYITPNFGRFLPSKILRGSAPQKLFPCYHPNLEARQVAKYHKCTLTTPKIIDVH